MQVYFSVPNTIPTTFDGALTIVRRFAATPTIQAELNRLKTGAQQQQQGVFNLTTVAKNKGVCRHYMMKGRCGYGDKCKFQHVPNQNLPTPKPDTNATRSTFCKRCKNKHPFGECKLKVAPAETALLATDEAQDTPSTLETRESMEDETSYDMFMLTLKETALLASSSERRTDWLLDSGATISATFDETDCYEIEDCNVQVKSAGSSFDVHKRGKARVITVDSEGKRCQLAVRKCLISDKFPYKLLSLEIFTKRGFKVTMQEDEMLVIAPDKRIITAER